MSDNVELVEVKADTDSSSDSSKAQTKTERVWNSLEVAKILVGLLIPMVIVLLTWMINSSLNERNKIEDHDKRIYQQRQDIYNKIGPLLNNIYTYCMYVGEWKQLSPDSIIKHKRQLDKIVFTNSPYFDTASVFIDKYTAFMDSSFKTGQGWGKDALIRSEMELHKSAIDSSVFKWNPRFDVMFTDEDNRVAIKATYFALLRQIATELDLKVKGEDLDKKVKLVDTSSSAVKQ